MMLIKVACSFARNEFARSDMRQRVDSSICAAQDEHTPFWQICITGAALLSSAIGQWMAEIAGHRCRDEYYKGLFLPDL
jgi:hypothetical protein